MTPVRLEPAALRSRVKHSTTEPLRSHGLQEMPLKFFFLSHDVVLGPDLMPCIKIDEPLVFLYLCPA